MYSNSNHEENKESKDKEDYKPPSFAFGKKKKGRPLGSSTRKSTRKNSKTKSLSLTSPIKKKQNEISDQMDKMFD